MNNEVIFKALSSPTRQKILKILSKKELHLSALAREINISKPVVSKHIKILEKAKLIDKKIIGNVHILKPNTNILEKAIEPIIEPSNIKINKEKSLFEALQQIPYIEVKKVGKHQYIQSIDGEEGYYIYEIDGKAPDTPIDEYRVSKDITLDLKKLVPVKKKNIKIELKKG